MFGRAVSLGDSSNWIILHSYFDWSEYHGCLVLIYVLLG